MTMKERLGASLGGGGGGGGGGGAKAIMEQVSQMVNGLLLVICNKSLDIYKTDMATIRVAAMLQENTLQIQ
jgi:hypothetical protein